MDKIKVNNQVVSMRKFVKQAKIRAINKCTKQIKFLENRKGNEEQMAKTKRKLQRLLEEIVIFKKIRPDSISKLALSKAKDWKAILAEKNVPLEERCFAILANHPPVQESVEKFHSDNSELISKIPELVKEWEEKKSRSSQINKKKPKGKQDNAEDPNKLPIGNKKLHKSNEAEIKHQSTESLENLPDSSNVKSIQNDITGQNLKNRKTVKRKKFSDSMCNNLDSSSIMCSPPKKKLLILDDAESSDSLSDSSDIANYQVSQNKEELPIKDETRSHRSYANDSNDSLSDSSDIANHQGNQNKELPAKDKTKSCQSHKNDSDDSLSDSSDIVNHQRSQGKEKLPANDKTKSNQSFKNSNQSKACAVNHETNSTEKKMLLKKETMNSGNRKDINAESNNKEENSGKSQDIRSKLLEISLSKSTVRNKQNNKHSPSLHQLNASVKTDSEDADSGDTYKKLDNSANVNGSMPKPSFSAKPEVKSKMKAIAMLDLDKLQDVDEIPIEKSDSDTEDETEENSGKQKKDSFFLRDGEPVSESDEDESAEKEIPWKRDFPSFKKKPYGNFNKREQRDTSFQKRKFDKHSVNGKNSNFREKGYVKSKEFSFKDGKQHFKRTFDDNSEYRQNKKNQFASKDKFSNRNGTNSFARNSNEKSYRLIRNSNVKGNNCPPNPSLSNSHSTIKPDDKPLHPSWEAKRKLRETQKVVFQGKKMVFKL